MLSVVDVIATLICRFCIHFSIYKSELFLKEMVDDIERHGNNMQSVPFKRKVSKHVVGFSFLIKEIIFILH